MVRMAALWSLLTGQDPNPEPSRSEARKAHVDAVLRQDTRAIHQTREALMLATHRELRGSR